MDIANNFKVIIALKSSKELKQGQVRCAISIQDKVKFTVLPQSEGQFFDVNDLAIGKPILIMFDIQATGHRIGDLKIPIPANVYQEKEVELADTFVLEYENEDGSQEKFSGRYYIIILNKGEVKVEKQDPQPLEEKAMKQIEQAHQQRTSESPTKQYIKSTGERTQERTKKDQSKKLLAETKYDPKAKKHSANRLSFQGQQQQAQEKQQQKQATTKKQSQQSTKSINKYNSQKQLQNQQNIQIYLSRNDQLQKSQTSQFTPSKIQLTAGENAPEESSEKMRTPPQRQQSPFSKYRGTQSQGQLLGKEIEAELEYWKGVVDEQQNKIKRADGYGQINETLNDELKHSEEKRVELQNLIREGIDEGVKLREEIEKRVNDLVSENNRLQKKIKIQNDKLNEFEKANDDQKVIISQKDNEILDLQKKLKSQEELKRICAIQQDKLEEQEFRIKNTQKQFDEQLQNLLHQITKLEGQYTQILHEKSECDRNLQDCVNQLQNKREQIKDLEAKLQSMAVEIDLKSSWELSAMTLKQQNNDLQLQILDSRHRIEQLGQLLEQMRKDLKNAEKEREMSEKSWADKTQALKEVIKGQDLKINDLEKKIKDQDKQILLLREQINNLSLTAKQANELQKAVDTLKTNNRTLTADNNKLTQTVEELTESLLGTNNQILELRAEILNQNKSREEAETHNNNLKKLILEMRERGIAYLPIKNDELDNKLANFINARDDADKWRQLFVREGEGVYQFGTKKIYIKMEQDKILIRSGGGYIGIEEFINLFSQREMDNFQRADPLQAITKSKAVTRKMDQMKLVNKMKNDSLSPLGKKYSAYD